MQGLIMPPRVAPIWVGICISATNLHLCTGLAVDDEKM